MNKLIRIIGLAPSEDPDYLSRLRKRRADVVASIAEFRSSPPKKRLGKARKKGTTIKDLVKVMDSLGVSLEDIKAMAKKKEAGKENSIEPTTDKL